MTSFPTFHMARAELQAFRLGRVSIPVSFQPRSCLAVEGGRMTRTPAFRMAPAELQTLGSARVSSPVSFQRGFCLAAEGGCMTCFPTFHSTSETEVRPREASVSPLRGDA